MKDHVIKRLMELPNQLMEAEREVIVAQNEVQKAKAALVEKETELLINGEIDGKNAAIRDAQLKDKTAAEREAVAEAEKTLSFKKLILNGLQGEFKALRSVAQLLVVEVE
ncbi:MAG: hypothetical protein H0Z40_01340 [Desulfotomaculum sp.]|nr:hypothetical protein [Desulfotomaculum sp.]